MERIDQKNDELTKNVQSVQTKNSGQTEFERACMWASVMYHLYTFSELLVIFFTFCELLPYQFSLTDFSVYPFRCICKKFWSIRSMAFGQSDSIQRACLVENFTSPVSALSLSLNFMFFYYCLLLIFFWSSHRFSC